MKHGNASEFADWLGVSAPYVTKLKQAGKLVFAPDGKKIDFAASKKRIDLSADVGRANNGMNAKVAHMQDDDMRPMRQRASPEEVQYKRNLARLKAETFIAQQEEMKAAVMAGELGNMEAMTRAVYTAFRALRDNMNTLGARVAPKCHGKTVREMQALIDDEVFLTFKAFGDQTLPTITTMGK